LKTRSAAILVAMFVFVAGTAPARATIITIAFSGTIDFVEDGFPLADSVVVGMPFAGQYTYDSETPDNIPYDVAVGGYIIADYTMQVSIGELARIFHDSSFAGVLA